MALKTFVKISEVNNLSDARYCAGMGVDLMGIVTDPSHPSYLSPNSFKEISEWVAGVDYVAELPKEGTIAHIKEIIESYAVKYIQFEDLALLSDLSTLEMPLLFKIDLATLSDTSELEGLCNATMGKVAYILIEDSLLQSEQAYIEKALELSDHHDIILGCGISADNIHDILDSSHISGIALKGGNEIKPGYKDFDELADILEALEVEDY